MSRPARPPLAALAALLLSYTALGWTCGALPLLFVFAALAPLSFLSRFRFGDEPARLWARLAAVIGIAALSPLTPPATDTLLGNFQFRAIVGQAAAAEALMQFWRHRPADPGRATPAALFFSGMTLLAACNTFDGPYIRFLAPAYLLFSLLAILTLRADVPARRRGGWLPRSAALAGVFGLGFAATALLDAQRDTVMSWSYRLLGDRFGLESAGMGGTPHLGSTFDLRGSPARVLRLEGYEGGHLRGNSFSVYDRGSWLPPLALRRFRPAGSNTLAQRLPARWRTKKVRASRLINASPLIYVPLTATALNLGEADDPEWAPKEGSPVRANAPPGYVYAFDYPADSRIAASYQGVLAEPLTPEQRKEHLAVPPGAALGIAPLARQIVVGAKTPAEKAERVVDYLTRHHRYSLRTRIGPGDPVADFLLHRRAAHCEFFASSAALLLRCAGVPTRYVIGYLAHEEAGDGAMVVRQRDAHAWVEAWIDGLPGAAAGGWMTVEATPADGRPDADQAPVEWWRRLYERLQDWWNAGNAWLTENAPERTPALLAGALAVGLSVVVLRSLSRRRRVALAPPWASPPTALQPLALRFEAALARAGAPAPVSRPWTEHVAGLPESPLQEAAARFSALYARARFGDDGAPEALAAALEEVEVRSRRPAPAGSEARRGPA